MAAFSVSAGDAAIPDLQRALASLRSPECIYFPVRHHSPACAWHLSRFIRELRPASILVEGPSSFTPLIPLILDPGTKPPVAIYTHFVDVDRQVHQRVDNEPDLGPARFAAYYPFCDYSPELVALRAGAEVNARLRFIDLDYPEQVLAEHDARRQMSKPRTETLMQEHHLERSAYLHSLAQRSGCRDFNEMWDHLFESNFQAVSTDDFVRQVATYCFFARHEAKPETLAADGTIAREQAMAARIDEEGAARPAGAGPILVVTGGFHTIALPQLAGAGCKIEPPRQLATGSVQQALIRYSFEQLDALNGYSAGMPSPSYYQRLWQSIVSHNQPHLSVATDLLVEIGALTRKKDFQTALSTADEIAAVQHARLLASLRGHSGPTREDILDGVRSCFVKGAMDAEGTILMGIVGHVLTGTIIGDVPESAGVPPIVASFRKEAEQARLNILDSARKKIALEIYRRDKHRATSRFLHSLAFLGIPFAAMVAGPDFVRGTGLERMQENWQYAWTPATESALIQAAIYGATIEEAATNWLWEAVVGLEEEGQGRSATAAVAMLIRACRMGLHRHTKRLLDLIAARVSADPSFVDAVAAANQLLLLWRSREPLEAHSLTEVPELMRAAYLRACFLLPAIAQCPEEEIAGCLDALVSVRELLSAAPGDLLDRDLFWNGIERLLLQPDPAAPAGSTIRGALAGLLYAGARMDESRLSEFVRGYVAGASDWQKRIGFVRGVLSTCREAAWQNRLLIETLDSIIAAWDEAEFIAALPDLRLALAQLTPRETDKVAGVVAGLHGKKTLGELSHQGITEAQAEWHRRLTATVLRTLAQDGLSQWIESEGS
jgi:hypothetical protein